MSNQTGRDFLSAECAVYRTTVRAEESTVLYVQKGADTYPFSSSRI